LLKRNEIYNKFWIDKESKKVVCFRAPMSCHNNIQEKTIANNEQMEYWYKYLTNVFILKVSSFLKEIYKPNFDKPKYNKTTEFITVNINVNFSIFFIFYF
jgi:hypothetical protein